MSREQNLKRVGAKVASQRQKALEGNTISQCTTTKFSYDVRMNHDKKAERGKRLIREIIIHNT